MGARKFWLYVGIATIIITIVGIVGCSKSDPLGSGDNTSVNLAVSFSKSSAVSGLLKSFGNLAVDSLRIDSAVVVLQRIKFESHIDTVTVDTTGGNSGDDDREANITFKGPFVIHVRDTVAINFASQTLPAGTYNGIKFKIHKLKPGEKHEDSDEHNNRPRVGSTPIEESSIVVWGAIKKNGAWVSFTLKIDVEVEFKLKGNFTVSQSTSSAKMALNFNIALWFKHPQTGALLDPTDTSSTMRELFKRAVKLSFEKGKGGHDRNNDGHPDD